VGLDRKPVDEPGFWEGLYADGNDGWELREPSPPLVAWLDAGGLFTISGGPEMAPARPPSADARLAPALPTLADARLASALPQSADAPRVAVPGCGRGHDARLLAQRGCHAVGFDFAEAAITEARALATTEGSAARFERRDIFTLAADFAEAFDAVWEYTCFCAIDPARREEYVEVMRAILKPGGTFLGCFYPLREGGDGPPFPVALAEVERLLAPGFRVQESRAPAASVERRRGLEWLLRATRV
jgi:SAM-dependent methyltransferase